MMKKTTLLAAALVVIALFWAVPAWPGTIPTSVVPEGARWVAHLDMEKFVATSLYGLLEKDGKFQIKSRDLDRWLKIDVPKDITGVTVFGLGPDDKQIVFAVAGKFDKAGPAGPDRPRQGTPGDALRRLHALLDRKRRVRRLRQRQPHRLLRGPRGHREGPGHGRRQGQELLRLRPECVAQGRPRDGLPQRRPARPLGAEPHEQPVQDPREGQRAVLPGPGKAGYPSGPPSGDGGFSGERQEHVRPRPGHHRHGQARRERRRHGQDRLASRRPPGQAGRQGPQARLRASVAGHRGPRFEGTRARPGSSTEPGPKSAAPAVRGEWRE